jgi:hypothetical protein
MSSNRPIITGPYRKGGFMKKSVALVTLMIFTLVFVQVLQAETAAKEGARKDLLYICNCGPDCKCNTVSTLPGKCTCGTDLKATHVVRVEGTDALLCECGKDCTCKIDPKDPTKCGCGKAVKRVSLKGTGIYFCNCGGSCSCNVVSDKPGKCTCGMDLKKVD